MQLKYFKSLLFSKLTLLATTANLFHFSTPNILYKAFFLKEAALYLHAEILPKKLCTL
jgi:hypothetical protein